nr:MAG TPA: hypothetical protein [Caudoviricetes sp.]
MCTFANRPNPRQFWCGRLFLSSKKLCKIVHVCAEINAAIFDWLFALR